MPGTYDIVTYQGATYTVTVTWTDDNEDPVDLSEYTARFQVRGPNSKLRLSLTNGDGIQIADPTNGQMVVLIDAATMASVKPGNYRYELELQLGDFVTKLLRGDFKVVSEVAV